MNNSRNNNSRFQIEALEAKKLFAADLGFAPAVAPTADVAVVGVAEPDVNHSDLRQGRASETLGDIVDFSASTTLGDIVYFRPSTTLGDIVGFRASATLGDIVDFRASTTLGDIVCLRQGPDFEAATDALFADAATGPRT